MANQEDDRCPNCGGPLQCLTDPEQDEHPVYACAEGSDCAGRISAEDEADYAADRAYDEARDWRLFHATPDLDD